MVARISLFPFKIIRRILLDDISISKPCPWQKQNQNLHFDQASTCRSKSRSRWEGRSKGGLRKPVPWPRLRCERTNARKRPETNLELGQTGD